MIRKLASAGRPLAWSLHFVLVFVFCFPPTFGKSQQQQPDALAQLAALRIPDSQVVFSPAAADFDIAAYLVQAGGALGRHRQFLESSGSTPAAQVVHRVALENSINPRLLLALLEFNCQCVLGQSEQGLKNGYTLGVRDYRRQGLYGQVWWASNQLSAGYYGWREGWLTQFTLPDGTIYTPAPDSNPGSVALQYYFVQLSLSHAMKRPGETTQADDWSLLSDPQSGFLAVYERMFGDPDELARGFEPNLPLGLGQPELILPFEPKALWSLTSGPHRAWDVIGSLAALDFAPAAGETGCVETTAWVVAMADGQVVRSEYGLLVQDLDDSREHGRFVFGRSDGLEQTGWAILYVHLAEKDRVPDGTYLRRGERIGHPSCEGGPATGINLHIARKYNGEWIAASGPLPFEMSGWTAHIGPQPYQGWLSRGDDTVVANIFGSRISWIRRAQPARLLHWHPQE
jgi:murein DD-endopeptidase MepM/ murein hydrolase activator NlpD